MYTEYCALTHRSESFLIECDDCANCFEINLYNIIKKNSKSLNLSHGRSQRKHSFLHYWIFHVGGSHRLLVI